MRKELNSFIDKIKALPIKNKYTKEELLIEDFLVDKENNIEIYYSPHNDYINKDAKIMIVGITPGFQQMNLSFSTARLEIELGSGIEEIKYKCKVASRFSGSMRKNIIAMLDGIGLNFALNIKSCEELFLDKDNLLHTISLIPYPTFVKGVNYSGHTPKLSKSDFLMKYVNDNFKNELNNLNNKEEIFLIPLGRAVEEILINLADKKFIKRDQILLNFPHPSGANVNRLNQFNEHKENMTNFIKEYFK